MMVSVIGYLAALAITAEEDEAESFGLTQQQPWGETGWVGRAQYQGIFKHKAPEAQCSTFQTI